jgi:protein-tyrosine phosphatase
VSFSILVVCSANICRSPSATRGLRAGLAAAGVPEDVISVHSAGVAAADGWPMCEVSDALTSAALASAGAHTSRRLTAELAKEADLILVADRGHRTAVAKLAPTTRNRTFTIRQAARLATWLIGDSGVVEVARLKASGTVPQLPPDDVRLPVPPLPDAPDARLLWLVAELDAARGLAPLPEERTDVRWDADDIGDPHVEGWELHDEAVACALAAVQEIVLALRVVLTMP